MASGDAGSPRIPSPASSRVTLGKRRRRVFSVTDSWARRGPRRFSGSSLRKTVPTGTSEDPSGPIATANTPRPPPSPRSGWSPEKEACGLKKKKMLTSICKRFKKKKEKMKLERGRRRRSQQKPPNADRDITAFGDGPHAALSPLVARTRAPINPEFLFFSLGFVSVSPFPPPPPPLAYLFSFFSFWFAGCGFFFSHRLAGSRRGRSGCFSGQVSFGASDPRESTRGRSTAGRRHENAAP